MLCLFVLGGVAAAVVMYNRSNQNKKLPYRHREDSEMVPVGPIDRSHLKLTEETETGEDGQEGGGPRDPDSDEEDGKPKHFQAVPLEM